MKIQIDLPKVHAVKDKWIFLNGFSALWHFVCHNATLLSETRYPGSGHVTVINLAARTVLDVSTSDEKHRIWDAVPKNTPDDGMLCMTESGVYVVYDPDLDPYYKGRFEIGSNSVTLEAAITDIHADDPEALWFILKALFPNPKERKESYSIHRSNSTPSQSRVMFSVDGHNAHEKRVMVFDNDKDTAIRFEYSPLGVEPDVPFYPFLRK